MTTFQKLIIVISISIVGLAGYYLFRQEQIRKNDLATKEAQKQLSDCKYLLANKDLILEKEIKDLEFARINKELSKDAPRPKYAQQYLDGAVQAYGKAHRAYEESAEKCRAILRTIE